MRIVLLLLGFWCVAICAAKADLITYDTTGSVFTKHGVSMGLRDYAFEDMRIIFEPVVDMVVDPRPFDFGLLGTLRFESVSGASLPPVSMPDGFGLQIRINQSSPGTGFAFLPNATISGSISRDSSSVVLNFLDTTPVNPAGNATYFPVNNPLGLLPPSVNSGNTAIVGVITAVPEPSSLVLITSGLLIGFRRRRRIV